MKKQLLLLIMMLLPLAASADKSGTCGDNLTWTLVESTGTLTIEGNGAMYCYSPNSGMFSLGYAPWYNDREKIINIVVENGMTNIGDYAFYNCINLSSITLLANEPILVNGNHIFDNTPLDINYSGLYSCKLYVPKSLYSIYTIMMSSIMNIEALAVYE
jgi:hypothetical protein